MDLANSFIAGWIGGIGNLSVGMPFDTVKVLMQNAPKGTYKNSGDCLVKLVRNEGPLALYKGVLAPMSSIGLLFAVVFVSYDATEQVIRNFKKMSPSEQVSMLDITACAISSGIVSSFVVSPAELLKVRQQTAIQSGKDGSFRGVCSLIYRSEGYRGFFRGTGATMMRDVPGSVAWFGAYEYTKKLICSDPVNPTVGQALFAGGMGGLGMWSFVIPLDTIKTQLQASHEKTTPTKVARAIFQQHGVAGFYRGLGPALLRAFPANAATFASRDMAQWTLRQWTGKATGAAPVATPASPPTSA